MRLFICFVLSLLLLLTTPLCHAGKHKHTPQSAPKEAQTAIEEKPATPVPTIKITQIRWTVQNDPNTKDNWLRLVMDTTGPVQADGKIVGTPAPHLMVDLKGAIPDGITGPIGLDGAFAGSVNISSDGQNSKLMIDLLSTFDISNCRIFILPPEASTNKPWRLVIDICNPAPPPTFALTPGLKGKVIVLDPGHGGSDAGAIGSGGTMEKTVTLTVAREMTALLEKAGAKVVLTRQEDYDVFGPDASARDELQARVNVAVFHTADIFISIHANAASSHLAGGTATYYYKKTSYDALLAQNLQSGMIQAGGLRDRSFFPANFYVVKHTDMPAALVELAFISNVEEEKMLNDPLFLQKMAQGITNGLERFLYQAQQVKILY